MDRKDTQIVTRTNTCKRCDSTTVTWQRSDAGKWYLTEVFSYSLDPDADKRDERTNYRDFHSAYCGKPEVHAVKQSEITTQLQVEELQRRERDEAREKARIEYEADLLLAWYALDRDEQTAYIAGLEAEIKRTLDGITMDYMTEFLQATSHAAGIRAEIEMYLSDEED